MIPRGTRLLGLVLLALAGLAAGGRSPSPGAQAQTGSISGNTPGLDRWLPSLPALPPDWDVTASVMADVTGDLVPEWVLLVWRPWEDWPIQRWSDAPSPIAGFHDATGQSCHLILLDPRDGREIWAGSALPAPLLALRVADLDRDGANEVVTVEGTYAGDREGPGIHVDVWRWNGFGFTLAWRSSAGEFDPRCLAESGNCGMADAVFR